MSKLLALTVLIPWAAQAAPFDLVQQGRILDAAGAPVNGSHDLTFTFYDAGAAVIDTITVTGVALQDGRYAVRLPTPVDFSAYASQDVQVGVTVGATTELAPRDTLGAVPRARHAQVASSVPVSASAVGASCTAIGALVWDSTSHSLKVCDDTLAWTSVGGTVTLINDGTSRHWDNGTHAASCDAYRNPGAGFAYAGATGSGVYTIDPAGNDPFRVWCDQDYDGGGWTKVLSVGPTGAQDMGAVTAVNRNGAWITSARGTAVGKVSNLEWQTLWANSEFMLRVQNPSDGILMANGAGYLKWVSTGAPDFSEYGVSQRTQNYQQHCDRTGDGITDQIQSFGTSPDVDCGHGTFWVYDHFGGIQCWGQTSARWLANIHYCGDNISQSGGGVEGTYSIYVRH